MAAPEVSVQLYSVNQALDADLDGTLGKLSEIGFRNVEAFDFVRRVDDLQASLARHGLTAPTAHAILIEDDVETPDGLLTVPPPEEVFAAAVELGVEVVIDPFLGPERWADADSVKRGAQTLNERAELASTYGLRVGYHNHDHELSNRFDGTTALEVFASELRPEVVLEVDLYWVTAGGEDAAGLLERLGDRVHAVHVKDGPLRGKQVSARNLPTDQSPAGQGDVPLGAALRAATKVRYAVVEFDHYEGDIFAGIAESYAHLNELLAGNA